MCIPAPEPSACSFQTRRRSTSLDIRSIREDAGLSLCLLSPPLPSHPHISPHIYHFPFFLCFDKNVRLSLPQTVGAVFIERLADYLLVKSAFGFSLAWDGDSGVYLKMSEEHHGAPCGLCGNFNNIAGDDLTTARGKSGSTGRSSSFLCAPT